MSGRRALPAWVPRLNVGATLTRRQVLGAGLTVAGAVAVAACGSDGGPGRSSSTEVDDLSQLSESPIVMAQRFPSTPLFAPGKVRFPVSLANSDGSALAAVPKVLAGEILGPNGGRVTTFRAPLRNVELPTPYFAIRAELPAAGVYTLRADLGGRSESSVELFDRAKIASPTLGTVLPPFDTPTADDHRGVEPYCTAPTPCPFHAVTLRQALAAGKPVIYLVGTPAHCQFGVCGPGLEMLVALAPTIADRATIVHAEVYTDNAATTVAPAVTSLNLDYEPVLYVTDASGVIVDRLDGLWDRSELSEVLAANGLS